VLETLKLIETQIVIPNEDDAPPPTATTTTTTAARHRGLRHHGGRGGGQRHGGVKPPLPPSDFHVTKRTEVGGHDKTFNEIRAMINKLSSKTLANQKPVVLDAIAKFLFGIDDDDERLQYTRKLAELLVSNPFLVQVYVDIYADLCLPEFPYRDSFVHLLNDVFPKEYMESLQQLQAVQEETDYDDFCEYNKRNDNRKARATFFNQATQKGLFSPNRLTTLVEDLLASVCENMQREGRVHEVEEMTENVAALLVPGGVPDPEHRIRSCIHDLAKKKPKEHPSWSSRALFKYMDISPTLNSSSP
jgi:hypothetical protein